MKATTAVILVILAIAAPAFAGVTGETRPEVFVEFSSRQAPVDTSRVQMFVDGRDVTPEAEILQWRVSWTPAEPLSPGVHHVRVVIVDMKGGRGVKRWSFTVDPTLKSEDKPAPVVNDTPGEDLGAPPVRRHEDFYLESLPRETAERCINVTGVAPADSRVTLALNGAPGLFDIADSSGRFVFGNVCLAPGENFILAELSGPDGLPAAETPEARIVFEEITIAQTPDPDTTDPGEVGDETDVTDPDPATGDTEDPVVEPDDSNPEPVVEDPAEPEPDPVIDDPVETDPDPEPGPAVNLSVTLKASGNSSIKSGGKVNFQGKTTPGAAVTLFMDGAQVVEATANNGGVFHFNNISPPDGTITFTVAATLGGETAQSEAVVVEVEPEKQKNKDDKKK